MNAKQVPGIRPPFMLYELHVQAYWMNSPSEPAVLLHKTDVCSGASLGASTVVSPGQARDYAQRIVAAADEADGVTVPPPLRVSEAAAIEAAARAYYGCQSIECPGDEDLRARFEAAWDEGRVRPEIMEKCRLNVAPLVLAVLALGEGANGA